MSNELEMAKRMNELLGCEPEGFMSTKGIDIDPEGTYAWIRVKGDHMTNGNHPNSIPHGSLIVIKKVSVRHLFDWPMKRPVCLMGYDGAGNRFNICHVITFLDETQQTITCGSLNPNIGDFRVLMRYIHHVFTVEQILRPMETEAVSVVPNLGLKTIELPGSEGRILL